MKELYKFFVASACCCLIIVKPGTTSAQVHTPRYIKICDNVRGFYEFLPAGYNTSGATYPLLVFSHGQGELGDGSAASLPIVLRNGPPQLINNGQWPASFTVNGRSYQFIVISPQYFKWPSSWDIDSVVTYAMRHYRVDATRVYVTGLSMGGGVTWEYIANNSDNDRIPKMVAAASIAAGAKEIYSYLDGPAVIARNNVPVFAVHNSGDPQVSVNNTIGNVNAINASNPPPNPRALDTIFNANFHGGWEKMYDPNLAMHNGLNIYQWMLQYSRSLGGPLPVRYTDYNAVVVDNGLQINVNWTTAVEENNKYFIIQRSGDGIAFTDLDTVQAVNHPHAYTYADLNPLNGTNFYRLAQVDLDGTVSYGGILTATAAVSSTTAFRVSPNPSSGPVVLELRHPQGGKIEVTVADAAGRIAKKYVFQKAAGTWNQTIDLSGLPVGSYFIKVRGTKINEVKTVLRN